MSKTWCRIQAAADSTPEIFIYDVIGSWFMDTDAAAIARQIEDLDAGELRVRINSPGGDAFDGIAIFNALRTHDAHVRVIVDGLAASAASIIAMAGDEIVMGPGSQLMVHEPWLFTEGNAGELRKDADRLDKLADSITSIYARRAGGDAADWRQVVADETWFTADEAVTAGLADRVDDVAAPDARARAGAWSLKNFRYAGRESAPAPRIPSAQAGADIETEEHMASLIESLRGRLGVAEDADEAVCLAALDEALAEQVADDRPAAKVNLAAELEGRGMVAVDKATLDELRAGAQAGAEAKAAQEAAELERFVQSHVDRGAITPAQREHYVAFMAADRENAEALLDAMPANEYPVSEIGHDADGVEDLKADDVRETNLYKGL